MRLVGGFTPPFLSGTLLGCPSRQYRHIGDIFMPKGKDSKDVKDKDGRGRKEHELKSLIKSNQEARDAFVKLVQNLGKMKSIEASLINDGIRFGDKVVRITNISTPTLAAIIKESGLSLQRGRPVASGSTIWKNNPQAIEAVCSILRKHGLHKGRCYLLDNGITLKNKNGEDEHFAFSHNGKKLLSITTLSDIAKENNIEFTQGPRVERVKTLVGDRPKKKTEKPTLAEEILTEEKAVLIEEKIEEKIEPKIFKEDEDNLQPEYDLGQLNRVPQAHSEVSEDEDEDEEDEDEDFDDDFDEDHEDLDDEEDEELDDEEEDLDEEHIDDA